jgi:hypothetical protein
MIDILHISSGEIFTTGACIMSFIFLFILAVKVDHQETILTRLHDEQVDMQMALLKYLPKRNKRGRFARKKKA